MGLLWFNKLWVTATQKVTYIEEKSVVSFLLTCGLPRALVVKCPPCRITFFWQCWGFDPLVGKIPRRGMANPPRAPCLGHQSTNSKFWEEAYRVKGNRHMVDGGYTLVYYWRILQILKNKGRASIWSNNPTYIFKKMCSKGKNEPKHL